jgi:SAM-dependent methyltransferase
MVSGQHSWHTRHNLEYVHGVAETLPFPDGAFDKVVSVSCLEHFADPLRGLSEMTRILKVDGRLALSVDSLLPENSPTVFREWHRGRHSVTHYFNQEKLMAMIESVGLRCQPERTVHLFRSRVAAQVRQVFIRRPRFWLALFPIFYSMVRLADRVVDDMHGQIIIVTATH